MSTDMYISCIEDHADGGHMWDYEVGRMAESYINEIRKMYSKRELVVTHYKEFGQIDYDQDRHLNVTARALIKHPECRLALETEYGDWIDIGDGVPEGANLERDYGLIGPPPTLIHLVSMNMDDKICEKKPDDVWYYVAPYIPEGVEEKNTSLCMSCGIIIRRKWRL